MTILTETGVSMVDFLDWIEQNPKLKGANKGYLTELVLMKILENHPDVVWVVKIPDQSKMKGDLQLLHVNGNTYTVEVKMAAQGWKRHGILVEPGERFKGKVWVKSSDTCDTLLPSGEIVFAREVVYGEFDFLAAAINHDDGKWKFMFARNSDLAQTQNDNFTEEQQKQLISFQQYFTIPGDKVWTDDLFSLIKEITCDENTI